MISDDFYWLFESQSKQSKFSGDRPTHGPTKSRMEAGTLPKNIKSQENAISKQNIRAKVFGSNFFFGCEEILEF